MQKNAMGPEKKFFRSPYRSYSGAVFGAVQQILSQKAMIDFSKKQGKSIAFL